MSIQSALYSGISGLNANGSALTVLGNNIANSNTIGFKTSRTIFSDMLSAEVAGSGGSSQIGRGTGLSVVDDIFSQGTFESTELNTDLAIEGSGFFMVSAPGDAVINYTRAGAFSFNESGTLENAEGYAVQGYFLDGDGNTYGDITDMTIPTQSFSPANPTSTITLATNLNANSSYLGTEGDVESPFEIDDPVATSTYASSVRVFDSLGLEHLVTTYFNKLDPADNPTGIMQWESHTVVAADEVKTSVAIAAAAAALEASLPHADPPTDAQQALIDAASDWVEVGRSMLSFDTGGRLVNVKDLSDIISVGPTGSNLTDRAYDADGNLYITNSAIVEAGTDGPYPLITDLEMEDPQPTVSTQADILTWVNESEATQQIAITYGATQYSSESDVISQTQDGYGTGALVSLTVNSDGTILGNYSNGDPREVARIALAKFNNAAGLSKQGNNMYEETTASGSAIIGTVGSGVGTIFTNSLEMSNVDLAAEFVKMITTQRGFQANSKIITTTDELLGELINLKR